MTRILIADDHAVVRSGVRSIIESHAGWTVVAEAADGKDAVAKAIATKPDVAVLAYALPMLSGIEATRQIRLRVPSVEVLIFTMHDSEDSSSIVQRWRARLRAEVRRPAAVDFCRPGAGRAQALFHGQGVTGPAETFLTERAGRAASDRPRAEPRATGRRGPHQQADRADTRYHHQNRRDAPRQHHAQADLGSTAALVRYAIRNKLIEP